MSGNNLFTFPLLQLPIEAQKLVVRLMDRLHQLTLSTFNDNTKQLVTSSGITCDYFTVSLFPTTRITIRFVGAIISLEFEEGESHDYKEMNQSSITAKYGIYLKGPDQDEVHVLDKKRFVVRDWIKHLLQVLNRTRIDAVFNCNASYQTNAILRTFKTFTVHRVRTGFRSMSILTLLENLPPVCRVDFSEPIADKEFSKILAQNYGGLSPDVSQKITLNHLLSCNCVYLNISNHDLTTKDLNRFLKIWTNSTLCTRLVYLQVNLSPKSSDNSIYSQIMKDIKHKSSEENHVSEFYREYLFNIYRKDGTDATIRITLVQNSYPKFEMMVWS